MLGQMFRSRRVSTTDLRVCNFENYCQNALCKGCTNLLPLTMCQFYLICFQWPSEERTRFGHFWFPIYKNSFIKQIFTKGQLCPKLSCWALEIQQWTKQAQIPLITFYCDTEKWRTKGGHGVYLSWSFRACVTNAHAMEGTSMCEGQGWDVRGEREWWALW